MLTAENFIAAIPQQASGILGFVEQRIIVDAVDNYIRKEMAARHIPGLAVAVTRGGEPCLVKGYGLANVELGVPVMGETLFEIASITKTFTAAAILLLMEEGEVTLSDAIGAYLDNLPEGWRAVTVRQLLTHTSGIRNYTDQDDYWKTTRLDISREAIIQLVADLPLEFGPGEDWAYSNTGYYLLGFLIEKLSGQSYGEFLTERILRPLGMYATRVNDPAAIIANRAAGYTWENGVLRNKEYYSTSGTYAAGVLLSSAADMAKWDAAFYSDKLFKQETLQQILEPAHPAKKSETRFGFEMGLGWFFLDYKGHRFMGHNGGIRGFSSTMSRFIDDKISVTMLWNLDNFERPDQLANRVAEFYIPEMS